jgi:hypothetical protein
MPLSGVYRAAYDYAKQEEDELNLTQDEILFVLDKEDPDWWRVKRKDTDEAGLVPSSYLEEVSDTAYNAWLIECMSLTN